MTVEQIKDVISKNHVLHDGMDALQIQVVQAAKRGSITDVQTLLKYISAVLHDNGKSAHVLFVQLMNTVHPSFDTWAKSKFALHNKYKKYTDLLYELYTLDSTGEGSKFMVEHELNVYSTLYHVVDDIYVTRQEPYILYRLSNAQMTFLRFMFGDSYAVDMQFPKHITCYEMAYLYKNARYIDFENKDELVKTVQGRKDYRPLSDSSIYDYSYTNVANGIVLTFVHKKDQQYALKHVNNLIREVVNLNYVDFVKRDLDAYRFVTFVEKE